MPLVTRRAASRRHRALQRHPYSSSDKETKYHPDPYQVALEHFPEQKTTEHHAYLYTDHGFERAHFAGPGTHLLQRLHQEPLTEVDKAAKIHDLRIGLLHPRASTMKADQEMLSSVINADDYLWNKLVVGVPMGFKVLANYVIPTADDPRWFQGKKRYPLKYFLYRQEFNKLNDK